jgi:hypothetical protein
MTVSISLNGVLKLDQTADIQHVLQEDDVNLDVTVNPDPTKDVLTGSLDSDFLAFLNSLSATQVTDAQKAFAALVEGASDPNFVTVTATQGETIGNLVFSDAAGAAFDGDQVFISAGQPLQTTTGQNIFLWSALGGQVVLATTGTASDPVVAAFYIESNNAANTSAKVESVTFIPIAQPINPNPDDTIDFSDILKVSTTAGVSFNFNELKSGSSLWVAVGNSSGAVLVSGKSLDVDAAGKIVTNTSNTIHTSQGGDGATIGVNNQLFDNTGETAVFTLVSGFTNLGSTTKGLTGNSVVDPKPNDNKPEGIDYGGYLNVTGAGVFISQSQGNDLKSFDITVWRAGGGTIPEEKFAYIGTEPSGAFNDDLAINVKTVTILGVGGTPLATWAVTPTGDQHASGDIVLGVKVEISANNIDVDGLLNGFTVNWTTTDQFNRFQLIQEGGAFDVGGVNITSGQPVSANIGDFLQVDDDGPSVTLATNANQFVVVDESLGQNAGENEVGSLGARTVTGAVLFSSTVAGGTDGLNPAATSFALSLGSGNGTDSGLDDTDTGQNIVLLKVSNTLVEGHVGTIAGALALSVAINNSGDVTLTQYRAVVHDSPTDPDEAGASAATFSTGALLATKSVADTDGDPATSSAVDLGVILRLEDDGPTLADVDGVSVGFTANASAGDTDLGLDYGSDGPESLKITAHDEIPSSVTDILGPITSELSTDGTLLTYSSADFGDLFTLQLNGNEPGAYTFTVLQEAPLITNTLDLGGAAPGGPVEDIDITAPGGTVVNFDGFLITNFANNLKGQFAAGDKENPPDDVEDVNVSTPGIGLKDNQMDPLEALKITLDPGVAGIELHFNGATGGGSSFGIKIEAYDANGVLVFSDISTNPAPKGNNELVKSWVFPDDAVEVFVGLDIASKSGLRINEVAVIERTDIPDFELNYTVTAVDGDTDFTAADFTVQIDGDNNGVLNV